MRCDFAGDVQSPAFCGANAAERGGCGDVLDVKVRLELRVALNLFEQADVAVDDAGFGFHRHAAQAEAEGDGAVVHAGTHSHAGVFGVLGDGQVQACGGGEGVPHDLVIQDGLAVVRKTDGTGFVEGAVVREFPSHAADGGGGHGEHPNDRFALRRYNEAKRVDRVGDGGCVGHGDNSGDATCRSGRCSRRDGFLVGLAGLTQVNVGVDQAGER